MADIFLSYRRDDSSMMVGELARVLERTGWTVWYAPMAVVSHPLTKITDELTDARCVVGLWSKTAAASPYVIEEFELAASTGKLLAVETDEAKLPDQFRGSIAGKLTNLNRLTYGPDLPQLIRGLAMVLGLPAEYSNVEDLIAATLDNDFGFYQLGNITIPACSIFGIPREPLAPCDIAIEFEDVEHERRSTYPDILNEKYSELLDAALKEHDLTRGGLRDNPLARLDWWEQAPEGTADERGLLTLHFSKTSYFRIWATNDALDIPFFDEERGSETTIRKSFCFAPYRELSNSVLANNPGVEIVLISDSPTQSPRRQVLIRRRSQRAAGYKGWFQVSASGHMSLAHRDADGNPSPFVTAIGEVRQEIADSLDLKPEDYRLIGLMMKGQDLHPSFYGYVVTDRPAAELRSAYCRDDFEGDKFIIAFDPETVMRHIAGHLWFPLSALALMASLEAFYDPAEVREAALRVPVKRVQDFYLLNNAGLEPRRPRALSVTV